MMSAQAQELRGDRGGGKQKKRPKAPKPGKGPTPRASLVPPASPKPTGADRPTKESGSPEKERPG